MSNDNELMKQLLEQNSKLMSIITSGEFKQKKPTKKDSFNEKIENFLQQFTPPTTTEWLKTIKQNVDVNDIKFAEKGYKIAMCNVLEKLFTDFETRPIHIFKSSPVTIYMMTDNGWKKQNEYQYKQFIHSCMKYVSHGLSFFVFGKITRTFTDEQKCWADQQQVELMDDSERYLACVATDTRKILLVGEEFLC